MKLIAIALGLSAALFVLGRADAAGRAKAVPTTVTGVHRGMPYSAARAALLTQGWRPTRYNPAALGNIQRGLQQWFLDQSFHEAETCMRTGPRFCIASFYNLAGLTLFVITGEASDEEPDIVAWCIGRREPCLAGARR